MTQQHPDQASARTTTTRKLAVIGGDYLLHGVERMHERPIGDLVDALNAVGARIE